MACDQVLVGPPCCHAQNPRHHAPTSILYGPLDVRQAERTGLKTQVLSTHSWCLLLDVQYLNDMQNGDSSIVRIASKPVYCSTGF